MVWHQNLPVLPILPILPILQIFPDSPDGSMRRPGEELLRRGLNLAWLIMSANALSCARGRVGSASHVGS